MQNLPRSIKWIGAVFGVLMLAALALFYTPPGLSLMARLMTSLSGGTVREPGVCSASRVCQWSAT